MTQEVQSVLERREHRSVRRQQGAAVAAAVALHALAVTAAFAVPRLTQREREYPEYVEVHVMPAAALGVARPTPPPPPEPTPEPEPEPEPAPAPPPEPPDPEIPVLPRQEPEPEPPPEPRPQPRPEPPAEAAPADRAAEETGPRGSATGTAAGGPSLNAQVTAPGGASFTYDYYLDQMLGKIRQSWVRPPVQGIETVITFQVLRNGEIARVDIRESSGSRAFDLAALRAVRNASPLPPLPSSYREESLTVNLIVR